MITAKELTDGSMEVSIKGKRLKVIAEYMGITRSMLQTKIVDIDELIHMIEFVISTEAEKDA